MPIRYVCIHGHFYQPPRENPWSGKIERQPSAAPHHDWNARITAECYEPNARARLLDAEGDIRRLVNNYAGISYNFGPTLLDWLERHAAETYRAILEADRLRGSAMAQAHGHLILPLANRRDKECQVAWGVRDFEHRFGRRPAGMWLPETAVDVETLEVLAAAGLRFTILAPHQARSVRARGETVWRDVDESSLDTTVAYEQTLPSGRRIALFFYDGSTSRGIAFEGLLRDGAALVERLLAIEGGEPSSPVLCHVATDGETYGHHHEFGEMALAYAIDDLGAREEVRLTHYAEFLDAHPPSHEVQIASPTSWSCPHGVGRWSEDCGCGTSGEAAPSWRAELRAALDGLRDALAPSWESRAGRLVRDPWLARERYIDVLLEASPSARERFVADHACGRPTDAEREELWRLMELQRYAMAMYTSCGWFFDDPARIETIQLLRYAGRAAELARELGLDDPEPRLLDRLAAVRSGNAERGNGRDLYERHVRRRLPAESS